MNDITLVILRFYFLKIKKNNSFEVIISKIQPNSSFTNNINHRIEIKTVYYIITKVFSFKKSIIKSFSKNTSKDWTCMMLNYSKSLFVFLSFSSK